MNLMKNKERVGNGHLVEEMEEMMNPRGERGIWRLGMVGEFGIWMEKGLRRSGGEEEVWRTKVKWRKWRKLGFGAFIK